MTPRERIESAFRGEPADRVPLNHRGFSSRAASLVLGREAFVGGGIQQWREIVSLWEGWHQEYLERSYRDAIDLALATGQDLVRPGYWRHNQKPTRKVDDYTFLFEIGKEEDWTVFRYDPCTEQSIFRPCRPRTRSLEDLRGEVEQQGRHVADYQPEQESLALRAQNELGDRYAVEAYGMGIGIPVRQAEVWLEAMLADPGIVREHIGQQVEIVRRNVKFLSRLGFRYFLGGLDFASAQGPMYSPRLFRELVLPGVKAVSDICHGHGGYHLFASDGNLWPVADALFGESGVDGYYEIDRTAGMDLDRLREKFPRLTLLGNISSVTLSRGTADDVRREALSCLEAARKHSGIVVGVSNYVLPDTPEDNLRALLETLEEGR